VTSTTAVPNTVPPSTPTGIPTGLGEPTRSGWASFWLYGSALVFGTLTGLGIWQLAKRP
jgi:hypothetical protein